VLDADCIESVIVVEDDEAREDELEDIAELVW
jgi:hypothetical protein